MATRTARRGLGARAILAAIAVFAMAAIIPAQAAHSGLNLLSSTVDNGWASLTDRTSYTGAYDPLDPAKLRANGGVTYIKARFNRTLCTAPIYSSAVVTNRDGVAVAGTTVTFEDYRFFKNSVMKVAFATPLSGASAPYSVTWLATEHFTSTPHCDALEQKTFGSGNVDDGATTVDESGFVFGLDRRLPAVPTVTAPAGDQIKNNNCSPVGSLPLFGFEEDLANSPVGAATHDAVDLLGYCAADGSSDQWSVAILEPGEPVVVEGSANDPLTFEDDEYLPRLETSGISGVHLKLFESWPDAGWVTAGLFGIGGDEIADWYIDNTDCGTPLDHDEDNGVVSPELSSCSTSMTFSKDITSELTPGFWYSVRAYSLDHAGHLSNDLTAQVRSGDSNSVSFLYLG